MLLINLTTGGIVETSTEEATAFLIAQGYKQKQDEQPPKKTTRKRTSKAKEQ